jgi:hypothetical protein
MNNKSLIAGLAVLAIVCGFVGGYAAYKLTPELGGDFAGGIVPTNVVTASASGGLTGNGYVYPVGSFSSDAANGLSVGGSDQYHGFTAYVTASGTPAAVATLGPLGSTTSTATSSVTVPETGGLTVGALCNGSSATTTVYVAGCVLSSTDGATGTATYAYANLTGGALSVPTSTVFRVSFEELPY